MKRVHSIVFVVLLLIVTGCGYKPASWYAKQAIHGDVFVDVTIDVVDPRNTVLIKDAMNEIVVSKFGSKLTAIKKDADTVINLKLGKVSLSEIQYDQVGYVRLYRIVVPVDVQYTNKKKAGKFTVRGDYDFSIGDDTVISDAKRFEAIRQAASNAMDEVISKLAIQSYKK
ncbi:MAG: LPS assembly lipoprotein LptE [Campylobacterota bacterium]|nr:LPS assembly lipoprotein LptE [Campylobacterota bacterium]